MNTEGAGANSLYRVMAPYCGLTLNHIQSHWGANVQSLTYAQVEHANPIQKVLTGI